MTIQKYVVSRDDAIYEAWPDVALAPSGKLVCVFSECTHHSDRSYTRIMLATSTDEGKTWSPKRPLTDPLKGDPKTDPFWNCPRISALPDGRLAAVVDRVAGRKNKIGGKQENFLWFSSDEGETWDGPHATPVYGIVPDQLVDLRQGDHAGRWILSAHSVLDLPTGLLWSQRCWLSDDQGQTWAGPRNIGNVPGLQLCEATVAEMPGGALVCFMRENSGQGYDCYRSISRDGGMTWELPQRFPIPGCHRPVAGMLASGRVLITHRYMQGGKGWLGWWTQNFFAALTDVESCLAPNRNEAHTRILPLDYDRSPESDTGYSGWVQLDGGDIYVVNYIVDDAPKAHIRGYRFSERDIVLPPD